jgi:magnesium-transporting ATPase (P-type)
VMGWPLPLLAAQILWLNLVTNGLQDVALAFEPGDPNALRRRPRRRSEGIVSRIFVERMVVVAIVMAAGTLALFHWEHDRTGSLVQAQTAALTTMVIFQVFQAGNSRSEHRSVFRISPFSNPFLFLATGAALIVHVLALYLPPTQYVLRVEPIDAETWAMIILVATTVLVASELHKLVRRSPDEPKSRTTASIEPERGDTP